MRGHLTYANVISTLCLVLVLGGGAAYAANTIFSTDIVNGEVKSADIGTGQVQSIDVKNAGLTGADVGQAQFINFTGSIGTIGANACTYKKVLGLPVDNKDHLVLTPSVTTAELDLIYTPVFDVSETGDMFIKVCNITNAPIDGDTTNFNLLLIDAD
jgi:hypothetical protein